MKPSERAEEVRDFLVANANNFQQLADSNPEHSAVPLLQEASRSYAEMAAEQDMVLKALGDREAVLLHVRNICDTACNKARLELADGMRPEDVVETLRTTVLRAIQVKPVAK